MGKAAKKKTRWRSFSFNSTTGSKEQIETTNDLENSTNLSSTIPNNSTTSNAKYSQILSNNNTTSTSNLSKDKTYNTNNNSNYNYYNTKKHYNKENYNYYNGSNKKPSTNNKFYNKFNSELNSSSIRGIGRDKSLRSELSETVSGAGITNGKVDPLSSSSCSSSSVSDTTTNNTATTNLSNKESEDCKNDTKSTNVLFNEDEYTRITTPRQDVLFKKGYLSRMKSKTGTDSSETNNINLHNISLNNHLNNNNNNNSASDPDTSTISTLSPATTPSIMEYGGNNKYSPVSPEMMDYSQGFYYPGYYDEHGVLIVNPIFANGYNYYNSPNTPSTAGASPVYLMPYPYYSYDYYMPQSSTSPNDEDTSNASNNNNSEETSEETTNDKSTSNHVDSKITIDEENNKNANINNNNNSSTNNNLNSENGTSTPVSSSEDGVCSSNQGEENKEDPSNNQSDNVSNVSGNSSAPITKAAFPMYPNGDMNNGYLYPPPPQAFNGYFNGFYYYDARMANGPPPHHSRQIKMKRRKRFINSRNSQHSTENTTDYSDDEPPFPTYNKRFNYKRYNNGYHHNRSFDHHSNHHHHHYNHYNYHYRPNRRFDDRHHYHRDMTANAETNSVDVSNLVMNTNLKVDVQEFYPRSNNNSIENQLIETTIVDESINEMQEEEKDATEIPSVQVVIKKTTEFEQKTQLKMDKPQKLPPTKESTQTKNVALRDTSIKSSSSQIVSSSTNHPAPKPHKTSKKEIFESLKSMEQQNIDLMAHSKLLQSQQPKPQTNDIEWNVIKSSKGKRIKFVSKHVNGNGTEKAIVNGSDSSSTSFEEEKDVLNEENVSEPVQLESIEKEVQKTDESRVPTSPAKDLSASSKQNKKSKKPKNKKNKKLSVVGKLEGFEIIEPEFGENANEQVPDEPEIDESNVQTFEIVENAVINQEVLPETVQTLLEPEIADQPIQEESSIETVLVQEPQIVKLLQNTRIACDDNEIIDINDNDIRCSVQTIEVVESKIIASIQEENKNELNGFYAETNGTIENTFEDFSVNKSNDVIEKVNSFEKLNNVDEIIKEEAVVACQKIVVQKCENMPELMQETAKKIVKESPKEIIPEIKELREFTKENKNPTDNVPKEKTKNNGKEKRALKEKVPFIEIPEQNPLLDKENFRKENIAELEREVVENLKLLDTEIEIKSPIIMKNLITDFPITNAIKQWLTEKQNESFDSLFHVPNDPNIHSQIYNMCSTSSPKEVQVEEDDISDVEELDGESDISDDKITNHQIATINVDSGVDSDYQSDIQLVMGSGEKASSSSAYNNNDNVNASSNSKKQNTKNSSKDKSNNAKLFMVKDKLCLLM